MSQTSLEISSGAVFATLVTFIWGDGSVTRYCRWTSNLTVDGNVFLSEPSLKVLMDKAQSGDQADAPIDIQMRVTRAPFDTLSRPYPHAKVSVIVEEVSPGDSASRQELFTGKISKVTVRPSGMGKVAKCKVVGIKSRLQGTVGMQALSSCIWALGQGINGNGACLFDLEGAKITGTVYEINTDSIPNRIQITNIAAGVMPNQVWNRGYVEIDGLRIIIRKVQLGIDAITFKFDLREVPPPDWLTEDCVLAPGCDKQIGTCRVHNQESQYCAPGIATPNRNPLFTGG